MKIKEIFIVLVLAVALLGCGKRELRHIVILPDVSGSIDRESLEQAFKAIDALTGSLHRGDRITIIPILGDAEAEASGRIIRFEVPIERRAYDADLHDFQRRLEASLAEMRANALAHPQLKTDILGSITVAAQEFEAMPGKSDRLLIVLSDFIQEDDGVDFRRDGHLANPASARDFVQKLLKTHPIDFQNTRAYLGLLRSSEYTRLGISRRAALHEFWIEYFATCGAQARFAADGIGLIGMPMR